MKGMEGDQEEGGDTSGFDACWLDIDGHIGTVNQAQQREEGGGFFHTGSGGSATETGRGRAVYPAAQFLCYLSHCFFPLACNPAGVAVAQKGWRSIKAQNLAYNQGCAILVIQARSVFHGFQHILSGCAEVCMFC